jgi:hypothetical protein
MTKIWYCANCGYEVTSRGRCHLCRQRLVASDLPELPAAEEDDEVGYRLEGWVDRERGRLIERLNDLEIQHRFEDDELVVPADDETRVDDLIADLAANPEDELPADGEFGGDQFGQAGEVGTAGAGDEHDEWVVSALSLLADAARRLRLDPTDMHADADVAEASAAVFSVDMFYDVDAETWAAVGRVTRRLLSALGADEALEDEIRFEAAILDKLLTPLVSGDETEAAAETEAGSGVEGAADADPDVDADPETVYELPEWLPEQRAQLGVLLDGAGIHYEWDADDLVVPAARESEVEALFEQVGGISEEDEDADEESRYRSLEELFAAADRLAGDPGDEQRAAEAVARIKEAAGPLPIGMDEVYWFRIMTQARTLSESIGAGRDGQVIAEEATALRDLLRTVV